jgi:D-alanyl-D-alanine-carboxypeptidase/D-alanyl-D-alanine-endopeptidase
VWVELALALIVEGYREVLEWWQARSFFRPSDRPRGAASEDRPVPGRAYSFPGDRAELVEDRVNGILDRHARKHVGVAVGVYRQGETWTFARGRISRDRPAPPSPETIFEIGSITKVFTATVLADLAEEGLVALHDPVQHHLPDDVVLPARGRPITLADLATQTSGLPRLPAGLVRQALRERQNPYGRFTAADLDRAIATARLKNDPGARIRYSNFGFGLLGHVLALRTGCTYEQLVRERICEPLDLADTGISIAADELPRFADGHNRRGRPVPHWDLPALAGAGALRSTVADLLRFLELQLTDPTTRLGRAARATHEPRARRGRFVHGLGWVGLPLRGSSRQMLWHNGGTGGFRSFAGFVPESGTGVVVLSNCSRSVDAIGFRALEAINES